jgi:hypothetical protein
VLAWLLPLLRPIAGLRVRQRALAKRKLEYVCRECGVSRATSREIASRFFEELAR